MGTIESSMRCSDAVLDQVSPCVCEGCAGGRHAWLFASHESPEGAELKFLVNAVRWPATG